jgi:hypothetical protein
MALNCFREIDKKKVYMWKVDKKPTILRESGDNPIKEM